MSTQYNPATQFESIKAALNKPQAAGNRFKDQLSLKPNEKPYTIRIIPNTVDPSKTFFHYFSFVWVNPSTKRRINVVSPTTFGERDPIAEERVRVYRTGSESEKEKIKAIRRSEYWLANVYIVNDPATPENNGTTKVLRIGKQLHKIITSAIEGDDAEEFGSRIFDLSEKGCNFKVKVDQQGEYPSYVASKFQSPKAIENLSTEKQQEIYKNIHDLSKFITVKSYEELQHILDTDYLGQDVQAPVKSENVISPSSVASNSAEPTSDEDVEKLLKELEQQN